MAKYLTISEAQQQLPTLRADLALEPAIITQDGQPVMIALDFEQFQSLLETIEVMSDQEFMTDLKEGIKQVERGETFTLEEVKKELGF